MKEKLKQFINHNDKLLGQHFLLDWNILNYIAKFINVKDQEVVEIGGGIGGLSLAIREQNPLSLKILEIDQFYVRHLKNLGFDVIDCDCLKYNFTEKIIMGNLPYNISRKLLINLILERNMERGIFMVQHELALRMISNGGKNYDEFSVISNLFYKIEILKIIDPQCFYPAPKVISAIIYIERI